MVLLIGPGGCGFTFLSWSIVYLRGDQQYKLLNGQTVRITHEPLQNCLAHAHQKDHICQSQEIPNLRLANEKTVVFFVPSNQDDINQISQFENKKIFFDGTHLSEEFFSRMYCSTVNNQYRKFVDHLSHSYEPVLVKKVLLDCSKFFTSYYKIPDNCTEYMTINYTDVFKDLDEKIYEILSFLKIKPNTQRILHWKKIYQRYKNINTNFLQQFLPVYPMPQHESQKKILSQVIKWKNGLSHNT